jgi:hypothetical protein
MTSLFRYGFSSHPKNRNLSHSPGSGFVRRFGNSFSV